MIVQDNMVVTIAYTLKDADGDIIDSSEEHGDFPYLHGFENIVPGLEKALAGHKVGDTVHATVQPEEGYGKRDESLVITVPRSQMPDDEELELGMEFHAEDKDGGVQHVTIVDLTESEVTLDGNHELADQVLNFTVTINGIREAQPEEIDHGHVHIDGHHHH